MSTYLKKHYLDDRKLAQRALLEFHRALNSERMIAFTGAMTTQSFGYPDWEGLIEKFKNAAKEILKVSDHETGCAARDTSKEIDSFFEGCRDKRVALSLIGELADQLDQQYRDKGHADPEKVGRRIKGLEAVLAELASAPNSSAVLAGINPIRALWKDLGIQRFATLNYDLELEKMLMLTPEEQERIGAPEGFETIYVTLNRLADQSNSGLEWREISRGANDLRQGGRIRRILPNGRTVECDLVSRERSDRLIDFAMGSIDAEQHILHLHGRCDEPKSMVFSYRDYDRLYRRDDMHRQPFEYGHRIMTGGNPILFVGLGMNEPEINKTLEDYISNTPYHRTAPTFLLWNSKSWDKMKGENVKLSQAERAAFRMDKLHRLGILTIFDTDILNSLDFKDIVNLRDKDDSLARLGNLEKLIQNLAKTAALIGERDSYSGKNWRSMKEKIATDFAKNQKLTKLWGVTPSRKDIDGHVNVEKDQIREKLRAASGQRPLFVVASAGWGKGQLGSILADELAQQKQTYVLHANAGFCFDTDSFLDTTARFLEHVANATDPETATRKDWHFSQSGLSRDRYFARINLCGIGANLTWPGFCIVNGVDRFIDVHGLPLSAEFDRFVEQLFEDSQPGTNAKSNDVDQGAIITNQPVCWIFLGSDRTRLYLERKRNEMKGEKETPFTVLEFGNEQKQVRSDHGANALLASSYLQAIQDAMHACAIEARQEFSLPRAEEVAIQSANHQALDRSGESRRLSIERLRRAFLDAYLEPSAFASSGMSPEDAELAIEILRALAFIGLPVEEHVLSHVPRIFRKIDADNDDQLSLAERNRVETVLESLAKRHLVLKIEGFEDGATVGPAPIRYGLHRAVMAEIRFRLGLPLSEAKLSTSFNMSLYVAQPVDGYIPEPEIHDELSELIDALIAAYKKEFNRPGPDAAVALKKIAMRENAPFGFPLGSAKAKNDAIRSFHNRGGKPYVACLRAALAVVRGYYSTTGLLTLDRNDRLIRDDRDGILLDHAERLDNLLDAYGKTAKLRDDFRKRGESPDESVSEEEHAVKKADFEREYGLAEPFYADELVWLQNERAVVRLAMGDLHEANRSFQNALSVNKQHVEYGDRSHNWRRIKLNQMTIEIERGELFAAERMIREVLEASGWPIEARVKSLGEAEMLFQECKNRKCATFENSSSGINSQKHYFLREDKLAIAIALGYRGMCSNLRGEMLDSIDDLHIATQLLRQLDEQRAFAYFSRLYAWALREVGHHAESVRQINIAIDAAQSTRQMDLVYRADIMRAQWSWERPDAAESDKATASRALRNALDYGVAAEIQRVRTEAAAALSKLKLKTGDHEVALQYTSEALTIATRYNLKLRMMSVRVRLGEIMIHRGDVLTGRALIMGAIKAANRAGFQRVVDAGQQALDRLSG
jgi:tetratricopeptide (TPR) repeat protein